MAAPDHPRHRSYIRMKGYDYTQAGAYFVTVCVEHGECLLGRVEGEAIQVNSAGSMVAKWWRAMEGKFPDLEVDAFVVMPNHFHGVVMLPGQDISLSPSNGSRR